MPQLRWIVLCVALLMTVAIGTRPRIAAQDGKPQPGEAELPGLESDEPPLLLTEPKTPEEQFKAAELMFRLGRPNLAKKYLQQLVDGKPDDAALLKLRDEFGPAAFLRMANSDDLQPLSGDLLKRVNEAARKRGVDPKYANQLLDDLEGGPAKRDVALRTLRNLGPPVVPRIIDRIAATEDVQRVTILQEALIDFGEPAVDPLIAALDSPTAKVKTVAMTSLGFIGIPETAPHLWHFAYSPKADPAVRTTAREALARIYKTSVPEVDKNTPAAVASELRQLALRHFRNETATSNGDAKTVAVWVWADGTVKRSDATPRQASLFVGTRFAKQALELSNANRESQALYLAMSLASAADPSWEKPLPQGKGTAFHAALAAGTDVVGDALSLSLKHGEANAAIGTLLVMRQLATKNDLRGSDGEPPIVAAMKFPDSRVQFTAATTVLNIDPDTSFRGVSRVVQILDRALMDDGAAKGLVVNANVQKAATIAGLLGEMGFDPAIAQTGRDGFKTATERSDVGLILLQLNTIRWPLSQTLANLRADSRTKNIPIAIYGPDGMRGAVQSHLNRHALTTYIVDSTTADNLALQLRPFLESVRPVSLSAGQRAAQRESAAYWLSFIAAGKRSHIYDLAPAETSLIAAVSDPDLAENAVQALSAVPSKAAQRALNMAVFATNSDPELRASSATLLATHIQRYGLLLTDGQVAHLKRLQRSNNDPALTTALAAVMGSLKPDAQRVGQDLEQVPLPNLKQ